MVISIVIPIYNMEKYLKKCIESVMNQTYKNLEIILVNDGSTDNSYKIMKEYSKLDNRIKLINKKNEGLSSARNVGINSSIGEYILNVDSDDWLEVDACENLIKEVFQKKSDMVIGDIVLEYENFSQKWEDIKIENYYTGKEYLIEYFLGHGKNTTCNKLIKKMLYTTNSITHPEAISLGEDSITLVRLALNCKKISKINKIVYHYRQSLNSMTMNKKKKILEYKKGIEIVKNYFFQKNEEKFFEKYEILYTYNLFYKHLFLFTYKRAKKENNREYLIGWNLLINDLKTLKNNELFIKNFTLLERVMVNIYSFNIKLGDICMNIHRELIKKYKGRKI